MSNYSNTPFALNDFWEDAWDVIKGAGEEIGNQAGKKAEETGKTIIDDWLDKGSDYVKGELAPDTAKNDNVYVPPQKDDKKQQTEIITNNTVGDIIKSPFVIGGAGLGISKLAGLNWWYSIAIGVASGLIVPKIIEKV